MILTAVVVAMACGVATAQDVKMKKFDANSWVSPQPVLILGTYGTDGTPNAMNAAWGGQSGPTEITISLSPHATTANIDATGEFTVGFATVETMEAGDYVGIVSGNEVKDKVARAGFTAVKASDVNAPIFEQLPMTLQCRVKQKVARGRGYILVGEIVSITAREDVLGEDGNPDMDKMNLIVFDPVSHDYRRVAEPVGRAWESGHKLFVP